MRFFHRLKPYIFSPEIGSVSPMLAMIVSGALASLVPAFLQRVIFDRVIPDRALILILPVLLSSVAAEGASALCRHDAESRKAVLNRCSRDKSRRRLSSLLGRLSSTWYERTGSGGLLRHYDDAALLGDLPGVFYAGLVGSFAVMLILIVPMLLISPILACVRVLAALPALAIGRVFLIRDLALERWLWEKRRQISSLIGQAAGGAATLRIHGAFRGLRRRMKSHFLSLGYQEEGRALLAASWECSSGFLSRSGAALVLAIAAFSVMQGNLTFGGYIAFSIVSGRFLSALAEFLRSLRILAQAGNAACRRESLENHLETADSQTFLGGPATCPAGLKAMNIHFSFRHKDGTEVPVLREVSFFLDEGEWVLLEGPSGEGKSTLLSLILGLNQPSRGCLEWGGISLSSAPYWVRRALVGAVPQHPSFFDGTIRDNLVLFDAAPSDRQIWDALEASAAADIVAALPGGLDSSVIGAGSAFSGGEKRRLAVARLMLRPRPLILLDEPTAALDAESARQVGKSLESACRNRTVLLVSHDKTPLLPVHRTIRLARAAPSSEGMSIVEDSGPRLPRQKQVFPYPAAKEGINGIGF